jgi:hypothetical protein
VKITKYFHEVNGSGHMENMGGNSGVPRGGGGGAAAPGAGGRGGAKMGIKAQGPGNDFFNRPTRAGWDHCQCHEVHVS